MPWCIQCDGGEGVARSILCDGQKMSCFIQFDGGEGVAWYIDCDGAEVVVMSIHCDGGREVA